MIHAAMAEKMAATTVAATRSSAFPGTAKYVIPVTTATPMHACR